jgi:multidrug efflux pump subunit AcrA (membrane-fusion protein)
MDNHPDAERITGLKDQLAQYWLFTLCRLIDGVAGGAVFARTTGGEDLAAIAQWPDADALAPQFAALAEAALGEDRSRLVQERGESGGQLFDLLACPLAPAGSECAAVVLRLSSRVPSRQQAALRRVEDAAAWFAALDTQRTTAGKDQLVTIVELVASCLEHARLQDAAGEVAGELAARLDCDRVSIGFAHRRGARVEAVSHSAAFDRRASLYRDIAEAMVEAMEQHSPVVVPDPANTILATLRRGWTRLFGPGHPAAKLALGGAVLALLLLTLVTATYRVTCDAHLEARTQRVVVAPQDGFIAAADARPGDIVRQGAPLGTLDDRDLRLELHRWSSQLEQLRAEYRNALASHDRSRVGILNARVLQAEAQLALVDEKLARVRLVAPFDGLVVSGDLSQALGSPVTRGQVLFTVAPLEAYRVILEVDERDIVPVRPGQTGRLVISSMPRQPLGFTVEKITPVSTAEKGRTWFQVEAKMDRTSDLFRPGMEGVAKIDIDRRRLAWIWGHRLTDWLRLALWSVRP